MPGCGSLKFARLRRDASGRVVRARPQRSTEGGPPAPARSRRRPGARSARSRSRCLIRVTCFSLIEREKRVKGDEMARELKNMLLEIQAEGETVIM